MGRWDNVPTAISSQIGFAGVGGVIMHGVFAGELQGTVNWLSGEYMLSWNNAGGARVGTPVNGLVLYGGTTFHYNASEMKSLTDASTVVQADLQIDSLASVGSAITWGRAATYSDSNGDRSYNLMDGEPVSPFIPFIDPAFGTPVDSLSVDVNTGFDISPNAVDVGVSGGVQDTNRLKVFDLKAMFTSLTQPFGF